MDEKIFEMFAKELAKNKITQEAEDLLLDMAEKLQDIGMIDKEVIVKDTYNKATVTACGYCTPDEEGEQEPSVYLKWVRIGIKEFKIEDYLL